MALRNAGNEQAENVTAKLRSGYPQFVITDSTSDYGTIPAGSTRTNNADRFAASAGGAIPPGTIVSCTLLVHSDNWAHDWTYILRLQVGEQPLPPGHIVWGPKVCPGMPTAWGLYGLAYDTDNDLLYCAHFMQSVIYKYSSDSLLTACGTIPAPEDSCTGITYCGCDNTFWVVANPSKKVYKITSTGTVVHSFNIPWCDYPIGIAEDYEHGQKIYITDRRGPGALPQRIWITDTLGNILDTITHPLTGNYGTRCLALDPGCPTNPPSLINMYTWFNAGGTGLDSCCMYELDRTTGAIINSHQFPNTDWNMRGIEYDPRDGNYWVTIMQDNTGGNNRILKVVGFNGPPTGMAEESPAFLPRTSGITLRARPSPFTRTTMLSVELATPRIVSVHVYDNTGRLVRTLAQNRLVTGHARFAWDGRDSNNQALASGIYFFRLSSIGSESWGKVVLSR